MWCNELGLGWSHTHDHIPFMLAGSAGGYFKTGQLVTAAANGTAQNDLFISIAQAMGLADVTTFGNPKYCKGPLPGLVCLENLRESGNWCMVARSCAGCIDVNLLAPDSLYYANHDPLSGSSTAIGMTKLFFLWLLPSVLRLAASCSSSDQRWPFAASRGWPSRPSWELERRLVQLRRRGCSQHGRWKR